jgi:hypothetical protein
MKEKILKVAKSFGFDNYMFVGNWNSYNIYTPYNNDGTIPCIGQPVFVLVKGEEIRVAEESEWEYIQYFFNPVAFFDTGCVLPL